MTCHIIYSVPRTTRSYPLPYTTTEHINTSTMKSISSAKKTRPARRNQRNDRGVSFDEMRRLMRVYGPIKCLRKRQSAKGGEDNTKADSVKRKFYRWFPDLDDRFEKDKEGEYQPKFGHEHELQYREEKRTQDGETLAKKRTQCRKERQCKEKTSTMKRAVSIDCGSEEQRTNASSDTASPLVETPARVSPLCDIGAPSFLLSQSDRLLSDDDENDGEVGLKLEFDHDPMASANIAADTEPLDFGFVAERGIFDDVESSFFGSSLPSSQELLSDKSIRELSSCVSSSSEEQDSSEDSSDYFEDIDGTSLEECCNELSSLEDCEGLLMDIISD